MKKGISFLLCALLLLCAFPVFAEESAFDHTTARIVMYQTIYDIGGIDTRTESGNAMMSNMTQVKSLSEALMMLTSDRADGFYCDYDTLRYIASRNEGFEVLTRALSETIHIITSAKDEELMENINKALDDMEADGTLSALWQTNVEDVIAGADPVAVELPQIEGAPVYKIGVSGDLPPLDYTTADGVPAGYNTALLAALSERIGVTFELVSMESGARYTALAAGTIDGFFWHEQMIVPDMVPEDVAGKVRDYHTSNVDFLVSRAYCTLEMGMLIKSES